LLIGTSSKHSKKQVKPPQAATTATLRTTDATGSSEDIDKKDKGSTEKGATEETNKLHFPNINMQNVDKGNVLKNLWLMVITVMVTCTVGVTCVLYLHSSNAKKIKFEEDFSDDSTKDLEALGSTRICPLELLTPSL
jgi:hypothetical protein